MLMFRRFFDQAVASSDSGAVNDQKVSMLDDLEKSECVTHHISSSHSKSQVKRGRLLSIHKPLILVLCFALTLVLGPSITKYAVRGYDNILQIGQIYYDRIHCNKNSKLDRPVSIAAPPWAEEPVGAKPLDRDGWTAICSSSSDDPKFDCQFAIDSKGDRTEWRSAPGTNTHRIIIDLKKQQKVHSVAMSPSRRGKENGGMVRKHRVQVATDLAVWTTVAIGSWRDSDGVKYATFEPLLARYVSLEIIDMTQDKDFVAIGDLDIHGVDTIYPAPPHGGRWGMTIDFPIVPVTALLSPATNNLITLASFQPDSFNQNDLKRTFSATWNPRSGLVYDKLLSSSEHDMFCPGTSFDEQGSVMVTGGDTPRAFSIYDSSIDSWSTPIDNTTGQPKRLTIGRGYQGQTFLSNGKTFMLGGAWSGGLGDKNGEIYDPKTETWEQLPNIKAEYMKMDVVRACGDDLDWDDKCTMSDWQQHHAWLFAWKEDSIFHAGPSKRMNWFFTNETGGSRKDGGVRADDVDAVCGVTSMYDAENGIILTAGGSRNYHYWVNVDDKGRGPDSYHREEASKNAFEIKLGAAGAAVETKKVAPMIHQRIFANGVILPTGETLVVGGQIQGEPFYDETWQPVPEIYSPESGTWREVARHSTPRGYHSWALLLADASVVVGGAGLKRPETDHYDAQIYYPSYFFTSDGETLAERPKINTVNNQRAYVVGETINVTTDAAVEGASLIRYSAATHALNNDLRRIKLNLTAEGNPSDRKYSMKIPKDPGVALPGYWMLFVLRNGVPSVSRTVQILAN